MSIELPENDFWTATAERYGMGLAPEELATLLQFVKNTLPAFEIVESAYASAADGAMHSEARTFSLPTQSDNEWGAWSVTAAIKGATHGRLSGRRIAIKDSVMVGGLPMMIGSPALEGFVAPEDATVVSRLLAEGAEIAGKAVCEDLCFSAGSHTAASGVVRNPWNAEYSAGGSSSGCAALVASGAVDMALAGDQGGSARMPAAWCGILGLKPTYGLLPYTGAFPMETTLDHLGPMARTVSDLALMLDTLAGPDGLDPRQQGTARSADYTSGVDDGIAGLRIALVREGFEQQTRDQEVSDLVRAAVNRFADVGAVVSETSVPEHTSLALPLWLVIGTTGVTAEMVDGQGYGYGHSGRQNPWLRHAYAEGIRRRFAEVSPTVKYATLCGQYEIERQHGVHYAMAQSLVPAARAAYDGALETADVLCMPTIPFKPTRLPSETASLEERLTLALDPIPNTAPFNVTGHPAISVPAGTVDGLPVGMMLVGRHGAEATLLRAARAFERLVDGFPTPAGTPVTSFAQ
ncbi:amidase [Streptomyces sp. 900116325]